MAESTFQLTTEEWILVKPAESAIYIIGDKISVQAGTDIDNIVATLSSHSVRHQANKKMPQQKYIQRFEAWKVVKNTEGIYTFAYTPLMYVNLKETLEDQGFDINDMYTIGNNLKKLSHDDL